MAVVVLVLLVLPLAFYGWAWASVDRSALARAVAWGEADVGDRDRFPFRTIAAGDDPSSLPNGGEMELTGDLFGEPARADAFDRVLRETDTLAFVVVHSDRLVYEWYSEPSDARTPATSFSVAKSFLSTLVGIAIDEGSSTPSTIRSPTTSPSWRGEIGGSNGSPCITC